MREGRGISLLKAEGITKGFRIRGRHMKTVLNEVSLSIGRGEILGIVGESGSGKSTLGLILSGLLPAESGRIQYLEKEAAYPFRDKIRRDIQIIFQHPETSFDPVLPIEKSMAEPYTRYGMPFSREILVDSLRRFGIYGEHLARRPRELSGGELQRLAIARVLSLSPSLLILDEPTSMLDGISQAQILNLFSDLNSREGLSYLFVTHDPLVAKSFCHRVLHIQNGRLSER